MSDTAAAVPRGGEVTEVLKDEHSAAGWTRRGALARGTLVASALATPASLAFADDAAAAVPGRELVIWRGLDAWRSEVAAVTLTRRGIEATGSQVGLDPVPYRLDYRLTARRDFVTSRLVLDAEGTGWRRHLDLRHDGNGRWTAHTRTRGKVKLPEAGGEMSSLSGALDCDLGFSPLTNSMPILRSGLDRRPGAENFLMAWVSVPDLAVHASPQRYEHVRRTATGSVVRFVDRGLFDGFRASLRLGPDAIVELYPELAKRVGGRRRRGASL